MGVPKLLIFSSDSTYSGLARLPKTLKNAGFEVAALCWSNAFIAKTRYLDRLFFLKEDRLSALIETMDAAKLLHQFIEVVQVWLPNLIIFGDELTVAFAHHVVRHADKFKTLLPSKVLDLLKLSLGDPQFFDESLIKHCTLEAAHALGLQIPEIASVTNEKESRLFIEKVGYPVVVKKSFSAAGNGVKFCQNETDFVSALQSFLPRPSFPIKTFIKKTLRRDWFPENKVVGLQQFIEGKTAMYPLVAIDGEVLAGFTGIKELTVSENGPCSLIRLVNRKDTQAIAAAMIKQFRFTGFASIDFIIEEKTDRAYLIEFNPRPVPVIHLGILGGVNLGAALFAGLSGQDWEPQTIIEKEQLVALFPQEWRRDPSSENLHKIYHDVPWDDPELIRAYIA